MNSQRPVRVKRSHGDVTVLVAQLLDCASSALKKPIISYRNHRFPPQVIAYVGGLAVFPVSVKAAAGRGMLLERGIVVSYDPIRRQAGKFSAVC